MPQKQHSNNQLCAKPVSQVLDELIDFFSRLWQFFILVDFRPVPPGSV